MDILYILGTGSLWQNNEIRYSLRSLERFGGNVGRIFIVGTKPDFINDEVTFIPCDDQHDTPHKNILRKVITAMESGLLPDHFLISSDDHFYIKPTNFDTLPVYYKREQIIDGIPFLQDRNPYFLSLIETRKFMIQHGLSLYQTNPHCNTHWDVPTYLANKALFDEAFTLKYGAEMNCLMGNLLIAQGYEKAKFKDSKLGGAVKAAQWTQTVDGTNCVSGVPRMATTYLANWLIRNLPTKSRYEK